MKVSRPSLSQMFTNLGRLTNYHHLAEDLKLVGFSCVSSEQTGQESYHLRLCVLLRRKFPRDGDGRGTPCAPSKTCIDGVVENTGANEGRGQC